MESITTDHLEHNIQQEDRAARRKILRNRVLAFITDLSIVGLLSKLTVISYIHFVELFLFYLYSDKQSAIRGRIWESESIVFSVMLIGYFLASYYTTDGQSIGKLIFNLKIRSKKHGQLSLSEAALRPVAYAFMLSLFPIVMLLPFITKSAKGIPDWFSKTEVVDINNMPPMQLDLFDLHTNTNLNKEENKVVPLRTTAVTAIGDDG